MAKLTRPYTVTLKVHFTYYVDAVDKTEAETLARQEFNNDLENGDCDFEPNEIVVKKGGQ